MEIMDLKSRDLKSQNIYVQTHEAFCGLGCTSIIARAVVTHCNFSTGG